MREEKGRRRKEKQWKELEREKGKKRGKPQTK